MQLEVDKAQKEADIQIRNGEVAAMQKEQDALSTTVEQLENQKAEAQRRLDELDDKVSARSSGGGGLHVRTLGVHLSPLDLCSSELTS